MYNCKTNVQQNTEPLVQMWQQNTEPLVQMWQQNYLFGRAGKAFIWECKGEKTIWKYCASCFSFLSSKGVLNLSDIEIIFLGEKIYKFQFYRQTIFPQLTKIADILHR